MDGPRTVEAVEALCQRAWRRVVVASRRQQGEPIRRRSRTHHHRRRLQRGFPPPPSWRRVLVRQESRSRKEGPGTRVRSPRLHMAVGPLVVAQKEEGVGARRWGPPRGPARCGCCARTGRSLGRRRCWHIKGLTSFVTAKSTINTKKECRTSFPHLSLF
jgi:hypothetical protein